MAGHFIIEIISGSPTYYAGSKRRIERRLERTTHLKDRATRFDSRAEAVELIPWLVLGAKHYRVIPLRAKARPR
jgi:hypothetical protein